MKREEFKRFVHTVFGAEGDELACSEFFAELPRYVDLERAGHNAKALLPKVSHHMHQCPECEEVYEALRVVTGELGPHIAA
ncbi:MAG: hypothetical protein ACT4QB_06490 [Gammaproteobacteria bacterium]